MPKTLLTETITSLSQYLEAILSLPRDDSKIYWYRGCQSPQHKLVPSLFRHPKKRKIDKLLGVEREIISYFMKKSVPYLNRQLDDEWEFLFFMQHFGIPTRLLDWTENPLTALFFAMAYPEKTKKRDAAIWVLNPIEWNRSALSHITYKRGVLSPPDDKELEGYLSTSDPDLLQVYPVALFGTHNSPRIVAQQGAFTVFGKGTEAMEKYWEKDIFSGECLRKFIVPKASYDQVLSELRRAGISYSLMFPDLDGLAKDIRSNFGF